MYADNNEVICQRAITYIDTESLCHLVVITHRLCWHLFQRFHGMSEQIVLPEADVGMNPGKQKQQTTADGAKTNDGFFFGFGFFAWHHHVPEKKTHRHTQTTEGEFEDRKYERNYSCIFPNNTWIRSEGEHVRGVVLNKHDMTRLHPCKRRGHFSLQTRTSWARLHSFSFQKPEYICNILQIICQAWMLQRLHHRTPGLQRNTSFCLLYTVSNAHVISRVNLLKDLWELVTV